VALTLQYDIVTYLKESEWRDIRIINFDKCQYKLMKMCNHIKQQI